MGKKFSELERAVGLNNGDLAAFAQVDQSAPTGYKSKAAPMSLVSQKILKDTEYASDLQTDNKTVLGAINEVNSRTIAYDVVSGPVANFKTSLELPIKSLEIDVNAVQESGTPTPASPLPIEGWSEVNIVRCGKNLLDNDSFFSFQNWKDDLVTVNDFPTSTSNRGYKLPTKAGETYTISFGIDVNDIPRYVYLCKTDGITSTRVAYITTGSSLSNRTYTFTSDGSLYYLRSGSMSDQSTFETQIGKISFVKLEIGSTASDYEPYVDNEYIINLGGTYYGGRLIQDANGHRQFTVTHNYIASYNGETINEPWISSMDAYSQGATPTTGAQVVYPLGTPYTIDLSDGEPIITLNGTNNIYADSGDASVEYALTIKDYIDKEIASVQALILNS